MEGTLKIPKYHLSPLILSFMSNPSKKKNPT